MVPGLRPLEVAQGLEACWRIVNNVNWVNLSRHDTAHWCAEFLEPFFMCHPFEDSNGRVARLVVSILVRATSKWQFGDEVYFKSRRPGKRKNDDHQRYTKALTHAHRHTRKNGSNCFDPDFDQEALTPLAR